MKKIKEKNKIILVLLLLAIQFTLVGYTFPTESPYVVVNCNFGDSFVITFARDKAEYMVLYENNLVNTNSSTVYGYCSDYERITFPTYDQAYRTISYQQTTNLSITEVVENHLSDYSVNNVINRNYQNYIIGGIGGLLLLCILLTVKR